LQEQFDEEVSLLGVGHPQDGAAVPHGRVVAALGEAISHMQYLQMHQSGVRMSEYRTKPSLVVK